jgi:hypothetical protein
MFKKSLKNVKTKTKKKIRKQKTKVVEEGE